MSATNLLSDSDLTLTQNAQGKMAELITQIEDDIAGVRVYATPGGCSGVSFGMSFTDQLNPNDKVREYGNFKLIVEGGEEVAVVDDGTTVSELMTHGVIGCGGREPGGAYPRDPDQPVQRTAG